MEDSARLQAIIDQHALNKRHLADKLAMSEGALRYHLRREHEGAMSEEFRDRLRKILKAEALEILRKLE